MATKNTYTNLYSDLWVIKQRLDSLQQSIRDCDKELSAINHTADSSDGVLLLRQMHLNNEQMAKRLMDYLQEIKNGEKAKG